VIEALYRGLATAAAPGLRAWLANRQKRGKEDPARLGERMGLAGKPRPPGGLVWLHAASVGESLSALPLVARLRAQWPDVTLLFTTGTVTSAQLLAERLPPGCIHQYAPVDVPAWVERFLDHWRPGAVIWVESEFWPNTLAALRARRIPVALVNARLSPRSFARWNAVAPLIRPPLDLFEPCLAQDETIAARLTALGARHVRCLGNLKFDAEKLPVDEAAFAVLHGAIAGRPVWLAASLHPAETPAVAAAHRKIAAGHPGLLTLVVPRHPHRGAEIAAGFSASSLTTAQRSAGAAPGTTDVYIADTLGELGLFYRAASIVLVGGSLIPHGGQNPLEAARFGCALVLGPHMFNFPEITAALLAAGGAEQIADPDALGPAIESLVQNPRRSESLGAAARAVADSDRGAVERVANALAPLIAPLAATPEPSRARA
jgi:3-deoxy-D-manno-octulosonic-acid transferase